MYSYAWIESVLRGLGCDFGAGAAPVGDAEEAGPFAWTAIVFRFVDVPGRGTEIFQGSVAGETGSGGDER